MTEVRSTMIIRSMDKEPINLTTLKFYMNNDLYEKHMK